MISEGNTNELTIDELSRITGMTVRNIRAHQSRGLLAGPELRARTGYYGEEHVARLRVIQELQAEGYNLKAIERLLAASDGAAEQEVGEQVLDFGRALLGAFAEERPEIRSLKELEEGLGEAFDAKAAGEAERLGLIKPRSDGRFDVPSPTLLRAGEELVAMGIPLDHVLKTAEQIDRHSRAIAESFVQLFVEDVLGPTDPAAHTPEDWQRLREALERLRPLATSAVRAGFQQSMTRVIEHHVEQAFGVEGAPPEAGQER